MLYATAHPDQSWPDRSARRYTSFEAAERAARRAAVTGLGGTCIFATFATTQTDPRRWNWEHVASTALDALGRVWTDLNPQGARLV